MLAGALQLGNLRLLLLPPIIVNAALFLLFARSLLPGHEAMITGFHRYIHHEVSPAVARYTRRLTLLWVLYFGLSLSLAVFCARNLGQNDAAWGLSLGLLAVAILFFVGEHCFRARFRQHYGVVSLWQTLKELRHPEAWRSSLEDVSAQR